MRLLTIAAVLLVTSTAHAGFITIDEFTNAAESDGLGRRTFAGDVKVADDQAAMISGVVWLGEVATITYDFMPSPLVVSPKFRLVLKNNQTNYGESGILRATVNGRSLERELFADKDDFEVVIFDFTDTIPASETIPEFRVDWLRPDQATGARELLIDSIEVAEVPEPRSMSLIGAAAGIAAIVRRRKR